jgi:glycosyltransferase involved in cell wall biosynthesis
MDSIQQKNPVVSVIIPVYNGERYLAETIESVIAQTEPDWELIAVNDGSPDNSLAVLTRYAEKMPDHISVITVENGGVSRARNTGVATARGTYVAFLDQDDLWAPAKLRRQLEMFSRDKDLGIAFTNETVIDGNGKVLQGNVLKLGSEHRGRVFETLVFDNFIPISSVMLRKELFDRTGGFSPAYALAEDLDFLLRAARDVRVDYIDEPLLLYRVHGGSGTRTRIDRINAEARSIIAQWKRENPGVFRRHYGKYLLFQLKLAVLKIKVSAGLA